MAELTVDILTDKSKLLGLEKTWNKLYSLSVSSDSSVSPIAYSQFINISKILPKNDRLCIVIVSSDAESKLILPFILTSDEKSFTIGERKLFSIHVNALVLQGYYFIGYCLPEYLGAAFQKLKQSHNFDVIMLGEIELNSDVYQFLNKQSNLTYCLPKSKNAIHWLIDMPDSLQQYYSFLSSKTAKKVRYMLKTFAKSYPDNKLFVIRNEEHIDDFLSFGEQVSRKTYQWSLGQRIINDSYNKQLFLEQAKAGSLCCFILFSQEQQPCAFIQGELIEGIFYYHTVGYDPDYSKHSVGTVLLVKAIEHLIDNEKCHLFDFGEGGDDTGYKSKFGTRSYDCVNTELVYKWRIFPFFLFALESLLSKLKKIIRFILQNEVLKNKIRKYFRKV